MTVRTAMFLDHREAALFAEADDIAHMPRILRRSRQADEADQDRRVQRHAGRGLQHIAIGHEGGVERDEGAGIGIAVFNEGGAAFLQFLGERGEAHALGKRIELALGRRELAIDEGHDMGRCKFRSREVGIGGLLRRPVQPLGERGEIGKAPFLHLAAGEIFRGERVQPVAADQGDAFIAAAGQGRARRIEAINVSLSQRR